MLLATDPAEDPAALLRSDDGNIRRKAAEGLGAVATPETVELLAAAYRAETQDAFGVKASVATALGQTGLPEAAAPLAEMLADPDYWVRKSVAEALGQIPGDDAVEALAGAAGDPDARVRAQALLSLGARGTRLDLLNGALHDPDDRVAAAALQALDAATPGAAERALIPALDDPRWRVRLKAAGLLARRGDQRGSAALEHAIRQDRHAGAALREAVALGPAAVPWLGALLGDPSVSNQEHILEALEQVECARCTALFVDLALSSKGSTPVETRVRAASVLYDRRGELEKGQVGRLGALLQESDPNLLAIGLQIALEADGEAPLPKVLPLARHENAVVRHFAIANLARYGGAAHERVLIEALSDANGANVRLALEALEQLGTDEALPALRPLLEDRKLRRFAQAAIEAIEGRR